MHLMDFDFLCACHKELKGNKATGIDEVTKASYEMNLKENLENLIQRLKSKSYRPQPVLRVFIPKPGTDKKRPLGLPAYEDKIVQLALVKILNSVYEVDFMNFSFGFRPGRSAHDALKSLDYLFRMKKVNYVVDADIKGFFDHVDHDWMVKFLGHRIVDRSVHHLIRRILKSGVIAGEYLQETTEGTPQGGVISPLLANIYLHYALDLWFEKIVKRQCRGEAFMRRFADDFVCCFQYEQDAKNFYQALAKRLKKFNLEIAEEKTKIIQFGRFAETQRAREEQSNPETFDFLGFTHYCGRSGRGNFRVKRRTSKKKYRASLLRVKEWIKRNRTLPIKDFMGQLKLKIVGYLRYYGITDNTQMLFRFGCEVMKLLYKWLNRRSQRKSFTWEKFLLFLKKYSLPMPKVYINMYDLKPEFKL